MNRCGSSFHETGMPLRCMSRCVWTLLVQELLALLQYNALEALVNTLSGEVVHRSVGVDDCLVRLYLADAGSYRSHDRINLISSVVNCHDTVYVYALSGIDSVTVEMEAIVNLYFVVAFYDIESCPFSNDVDIRELNEVRDMRCSISRCNLSCYRIVAVFSSERRRAGLVVLLASTRPL